MSVVWDGLEELKAQLRELPASLAAEASHIVQGAANGAETDVKAVYGQHVLTGHLRDRVSSSTLSLGNVAAGVVVKSSDPLAWIFEEGSEARHYVTVKGVQHVTGKMPPSHAFVRAMTKARRRMYDQLKMMLTQAGLTVSGEP